MMNFKRLGGLALMSLIGSLCLAATSFAQSYSVSISGQNMPLLNNLGAYYNPVGHWQTQDYGTNKLLIGNLIPGQKLTFSSVSGAVAWGQGTYYCNQLSAGDNKIVPKLMPVLQFSNDANQVVYAGVATLNNGNAIRLYDVLGQTVTVPPGATRLWGSWPDSRYNDNSGSCVLAVTLSGNAQCSDGIDNDGDGLIDALVELSPTNTESATIIGSEAIRAILAARGYYVPSPQGAGFRPDSATATKICELKGYRNAQVTAQGGYDSCGDNYIAYWRASTNSFPYYSACQSDLHINAMTCTSRSAQCSDGIDNDGDGAIDYPNDTGCATPNDDNEKPHDPGCTDPTDPDETTPIPPAGLLSLRTECVNDNKDGTFTAYFGYQNSSSAVIGVSDNAAAGTVNSFSPVPTNRGQPTIFQPGVQRGVLPVVFDGSNLTWTVKQAANLNPTTATASRNTAACQPLIPVAECYSPVGDGTINGTFGYTNSNGFPIISIPGGLNNYFTPGAGNRGQPTTFAAGSVASVFTVNFSGALTWVLNGNAATSSTALATCPGSACTQTSTVEVKSNLDQIAQQFADLTKRSANFIAQNPSLSLAAKRRAKQDAIRSGKKADRFVVVARNLLLQIPEVMKNCPLNPEKICSTIDRTTVIEQLADLYRRQYSATRRNTSRGNFNTTGATKRNDKLILEAKALKVAGEQNIAQLPKVVTDCE